MMGIRGLPPADQAGLRGDELEMLFVADAPRFADRKDAFVDTTADAAARVIEPAKVHPGIIDRGARSPCRVWDRYF